MCVYIYIYMCFFVCMRIYTYELCIHIYICMMVYCFIIHYRYIQNAECEGWTRGCLEALGCGLMKNLMKDSRSLGLQEQH